MSGFDLDAYLARIGHDGPRAPDLDTLAALQARQPAAIPFENLDPLLKRPVSLALDAVQAKLVAGRRGGYCFELNALFAAALGALGMRVTTLAARVRRGRPPDAPDGPRTHMLLRVDLPGGPYLADAGFGGYLLDAPLRLERDVEQSTPGGTFRLVGDARVQTLQVVLPAGWQDLYRFTPEPHGPADYLVGNWYTSTHPASLFTTNLLAARLTPACRYNLFNRSLTTCGGGTVVQRTLASARELGAVLEGDFAITLPVPPAEIWARLPPG